MLEAQRGTASTLTPTSTCFGVGQTAQEPTLPQLPHVTMEDKFWLGRVLFYFIFNIFYRLFHSAGFDTIYPQLLWKQSQKLFLRIPKGQGRARVLAEDQHSTHQKEGDEELGNYCLANKCQLLHRYQNKRMKPLVNPQKITRKSASTNIQLLGTDDVNPSSILSMTGLQAQG